MSLLKGRPMSGNHHPCSFCECFICGEDGFVRSTEPGDFHIVLCDNHFMNTSEQYVSVRHDHGTMIVCFSDLDWDVPGSPRYLDLMSFVQLMIKQDVTNGDNL